MRRIYATTKDSDAGGKRMEDGSEGQRHPETQISERPRVHMREPVGPLFGDSVRSDKLQTCHWEAVYIH